VSTRAMKMLKKGDRVRMKVRTLMGFKGCGTVVDMTPSGLVCLRRDGRREDDYCFAMRHQVAKITGGKRRKTL